MTLTVEESASNSAVLRGRWVLEAGEDAVSINGVHLDLRSNNLRGKWLAHGVDLIVSPMGVWFGWAKSLGGAITGGWLQRGDSVCVIDVKRETVKDPALPDTDLQRATATVEVTRAAGERERCTDRIFYTAPGMIEANGALIAPTLGLLEMRLENLAGSSSAEREARARHAVMLERRTDLFADISAGIYGCLDEALVQTAFGEAAAFGYSLAVAESELLLRPKWRAFSERQGQHPGADAKRSEWWKPTATRLAQRLAQSATTREELVTKIQSDWPPEITRPASQKGGDIPGRTQLSLHIKELLEASKPPRIKLANRRQK